MIIQKCLLFNIENDDLYHGSLFETELLRDDDNGK